MSAAGRAFVTDLVLVLTAMTLAAGLAGVLWHKWALPTIRREVVTPIQETNRQVTVNGHTSKQPTFLDTVHTLTEEVQGVRSQVEDAKTAFHLAALMFEGHVTASELDRTNLWAAVGRLEQSNTAAVEAMATRLEQHLAAITESKLK